VTILTPPGEGPNGRRKVEDRPSAAEHSFTPGSRLLTGIGLGLGILCANEPGEWVTEEQCLGGYTLLGAGAGFLIGALVKNDVWAPTSVPRRSERPVPVVTAGPTWIGVRVPLLLLQQ
jgi:hypothetical protein